MTDAALAGFNGFDPTFIREVLKKIKAALPAGKLLPDAIAEMFKETDLDVE